jgi:hypothetical protein
VFDLFVTERNPRIWPTCPRCGLRAMVTRIEPSHGEEHTLVYSYECLCGEKIGEIDDTHRH